MKRIIIPGVLLLVIVMSFGFSNDFRQDKAIKQDKKMVAEDKDFQKEVTAVFKMHCAVSGCHKGTYPKKKLSLEPEKFLEATINVNSLQIDSLKLVDIKQPEKSYLLKKVKGSDGIVESRMPIDAPPLIDEQIEVIEKWIQSLKVAATDKKALEKPEAGKKAIKK